MPDSFLLQLGDLPRGFPREKRVELISVDFRDSLTDEKFHELEEMFEREEQRGNASPHKSIEPASSTYPYLPKYNSTLALN